jgi:UDP-glucose 4-epimerase
MTIWVTGADGFIGRHLVSHLAGAGERVLGLGHRDQAGPDSHVDRIEGDCDLSLFRAAGARTGAPRVIYHLAGGGSVGRSYEAPIDDFQRTVAVTAILLEWIRCEAPSARLVFVSSAAIYGDGHSGVIAEGVLPKPFSPYGAHKYAAEHLCMSAASNFGADVRIVRPFSIYGEGLRKQLLWDCCRRLMPDPASLILGGHGDELRDWLHVADLSRMLLLVGSAEQVPIVLNAGSGRGVTVAQVVTMLLDAWNSEAKLEFSGSSRPGDPRNLVADVDAAASLGFLPTVPLADGIAAYVRWFKRNAS